MRLRYPLRVKSGNHETSEPCPFAEGEEAAAEAGDKAAAAGDSDKPAKTADKPAKKAKKKDAEA